ncbi:proline--tRNA ligase [Candidatus Roizmanbacteria bacterium CG_4_10_14_0_8_um_filter_33_9]|uniref:Proline--tRNA ligase n=1 Tax=Candidatus Roizmanbacteria bacterium CG_4_10_14_0_8_um_filter_33_9 TaxID=1974826 RepID=A0A2M7QIC2_9BACT|nr:MAG: proline--tRNA ligase [Candidatus Roizmanbacteria bacterium CG_4_10_14_0_8_um_filter_33_9]
MYYSKLFGKTVRKAPSDASTASHKLLYQAGFIRESTAGRYFFLPLGQRVQQKIMKVIKEEMDQAGAQEMISPVLHPLELWKETNRTNTTGFELMKVQDRRGAEFALGGTAEEMFVDVVRKFQLSYKDLPFNIYQFSTKFRDELRARGGLLRVREFIMKDAYSFDVDETSFKKKYEKMKKTYTKIFDRLGIPTQIVESDNGYIGGEYCHEFVMEAKQGESKYLFTADGSYAAHQDVAVFLPANKNIDDEMLPLQEIEAIRGTTMEDGVKLHKKPLWQQIKDVLFVDEKGRFILAIIRGDYDVNEIKLKHLTKSIELRHATDDEIKKKINSEPGFISPVNIKKMVDKNVKLLIVADTSLRTIKNAYGGANQKNRDLFNMNIDQDYKPDLEGDIALAKEGYMSKDGKQRLIEKQGIEVGNIFQLGYHYSRLMRDASFIDKDGKAKPYYMGCYGIGIGRTMAALVEKYHDEKGIMWPLAVAPFRVHLISIGKEQTDKDKAEKLYKELCDRNIDVLFDDRDISPGEKFADADLVGIPIRLVISPKTGDKAEYKERNKKEIKIVTINELFNSLTR